MVTADEGWMTAAAGEGRIADRRSSGRAGVQQLVQRGSSYERDIHRQAEETCGRLGQTRDPRLHGGEHAVGVPGVHNRPGTQMLDDGGRFGRPVTDNHMHAGDPDGLKQSDDTLQDRHSAERHQRFEVAHALGKPGREYQRGDGFGLHANRFRARACTSSATILTPISSQLSASMSRPMGEWTLFNSLSGYPSFSSELKM